MKKLTKTINRRKKNYKPTIGLMTKAGRRLSFNATEYYIERDKEEVRKAKREAKQIMNKVIREHMPTLAAMMDYFNGYFEETYGCNPYEVY